MNNQPFVIERTYNAPVARVWKAITTKEAMKQWYFDIAEFEPKVGFEFQFTGQDHDCKDYVHLCKVTEVIPEQKLQHTWDYEGHEGSTLVTIELFTEGDKTRLKITHEGIHTLPALPAFAKDNFAQGWTEIVGNNLRDYVEEGTLVKSITVNATPEKVWEVIATEAGIRQWGNAFMEGTYAESTFEMGAEVAWKIPDGTTVVKGVITKLEKPKVLEITYYDDPTHTVPMPLDRYVERFSTNVANGETLITIHAGPLAKTWTNMHAPMWDKALEIMKEMAES